MADCTSARRKIGTGTGTIGHDQNSRRKTARFVIARTGMLW